jgi:hypothetical protein
MDDRKRNECDDRNLMTNLSKHEYINSLETSLALFFASTSFIAA